MFQNYQVCEFCRLELFLYRAFAAPFNALTLLYTLKRIQPPQTTQRLPDTSSRYPWTLQDNNRHQQTPNNTSRRCQTPKKAVQGFLAVYVDIKWRFRGLMVSDDGLHCLMLSADVERVSKTFLKGCLSAVYGFI